MKQLPGGHVCDERCVCPFHQTPLLWAPGIAEHACQDADCEFGHGLESRLRDRLRELAQEGRATGPIIVMVDECPALLAEVRNRPAGDDSWVRFQHAFRSALTEYRRSK